MKNCIKTISVFLLLISSHNVFSQTGGPDIDSLMEAAQEDAFAQLDASIANPDAPPNPNAPRFTNSSRIKYICGSDSYTLIRGTRLENTSGSIPQVSSFIHCGGSSNKIIGPGGNVYRLASSGLYEVNESSSLETKDSINIASMFIGELGLEHMGAELTAKCIDMVGDDFTGSGQERTISYTLNGETKTMRTLSCGNKQFDPHSGVQVAGLGADTSKIDDVFAEMDAEIARLNKICKENGGTGNGQIRSVSKTLANGQTFTQEVISCSGTSDIFEKDGSPIDGGVNGLLSRAEAAFAEQERETARLNEMCKDYGGSGTIRSRSERQADGTVKTVEVVSCSNGNVLDPSNGNILVTAADGGILAVDPLNASATAKVVVLPDEVEVVQDETVAETAPEIIEVNPDPEPEVVEVAPPVQVDNFVPSTSFSSGFTGSNFAGGGNGFGGSIERATLPEISYTLGDYSAGSGGGFQLQLVSPSTSLLGSSAGNSSGLGSNVGFGTNPLHSTSSGNPLFDTPLLGDYTLSTNPDLLRPVDVTVPGVTPASETIEEPVVEPVVEPEDETAVVAEVEVEEQELLSSEELGAALAKFMQGCTENGINWTQGQTIQHRILPPRDPNAPRGNGPRVRSGSFVETFTDYPAFLFPGGSFSNDRERQDNFAKAQCRCIAKEGENAGKVILVDINLQDPESSFAACDKESERRTQRPEGFMAPTQVRNNENCTWVGVPDLYEMSNIDLGETLSRDGNSCTTDEEAKNKCIGMMRCTFEGDTVETLVECDSPNTSCPIQSNMNCKEME